MRPMPQAVKAYTTSPKTTFRTVTAAQKIAGRTRYRPQMIEAMSGKSNVLFWLERHGIPAADDVVERIYQRAKKSDHTLTEAEILECVPASAERK